MKLKSLLLLTPLISWSLVAAAEKPHEDATQEEIGKKACATNKIGTHHSAAFKSITRLEVSFFRTRQKDSVQFYAVGCGRPSLDFSILKVARAKNGKIYEMPGELPELLDSLSIVISDSKTASDYANAYMALDRQRNLVVSNFKDIPGYGKKPIFGSPKILSKEQTDQIKPISVVSITNGYTVTLFAWNADTGELSKAVLEISPAGVTHLNRTRVVESVGIPSPPI